MQPVAMRILLPILHLFPDVYNISLYTFFTRTFLITYTFGLVFFTRAMISGVICHLHSRMAIARLMMTANRQRQLCVFKRKKYSNL